MQTPCADHELQADIFEMWCYIMALDDLASLEVERMGREYHRALVDVSSRRVGAKA